MMELVDMLDSKSGGRKVVGVRPPLWVIVTYIYMMYFIYAIRSLHKNFTYVGITNNIPRRLGEHNNKTLTSTKYYAPFALIYREKTENSKSARIREKYLKSGH